MARRIALMAQDWLARARCAAVTTIDLTRWSIAGEIARPVAVSAPDQTINPVPRLWSPTAVHRRPRLTRAVGAASGQDREKAAAWGEGGGLAILVPCSTPLFSPSPGQRD